MDSSDDFWLRALAKSLKVLSATGFGCMGLLATILYFAQSTLIYPSNFPPGSRTQVPTPDSFDLPYEDVTLDTPDGEKIKLFVIKQQDPELRRGHTVVVFCANAGNMGHRLPIASAFFRVLEYNVVLFSYRGYGLSTGSPSEKGIKVDCDTVLDYVRHDADMGASAVVLYGQSLGGAAAIDMAVKHEDEIAGLIVENTFRSIPTLVPSVLPVARYFTFLCHQIWSSETVLPRLTKVPVLFLSGLADELVPPSHMRALYDGCQAPKMWRSFPGGTHNETITKDGYWTAVIDFASEYMDKKLE
ncbi:Alpha/Beta hydrolase protein [Dipodascopsis tothii]|uniref:Alpha/Beta hydrolase protein n=1 Tax=Dipodascopsis tothii TaxID=44089 RepID=UPI0034CD53EC